MGKKAALAVAVLFAIYAVAYNLSIALHGDEAYYWQWGKNLGLSYYDHPPMVAYLLAISSAIFGDTLLAIRLLAVLCTLFTLWFLYQLSAKTGDELSAFYCLIIFLSLPAMHLGSMISTPDAPLLMFWAATLYTAYQAVISNKWRWYLLCGLALGGAFLSKYTAILLLPILLLFVLINSAKKLLSIKPYCSVLVAGIVALPIAIWNYQFDFISLRFQYQHGTGDDGFNYKTLAEFFGGSIIMATPLVLLLIAVAVYYLVKQRLFKAPPQQVNTGFFSAKTANSTPLMQLMWLNSLLVFGFFAYKAAFKHMELNWYAPLVLSTTVLAAIYAANIARRRQKILIAASLLLLLLNLVLVAMIRYPGALGLSNKMNLHYRIFGEDLAIAEYAKIHAKYKNDLACADYYDRAALMSFYLPGKPKVHEPFSGRINMFEFWNLDFDYRGKNCLLLVDAPLKKQYAANCSSVELIKKLQFSHQNFARRDFYIYRCQQMLKANYTLKN